jgi:hypothetical protein
MRTMPRTLEVRASRGDIASAASLVRQLEEEFAGVRLALAPELEGAKR